MSNDREIEMIRERLVLVALEMRFLKLISFEMIVQLNFYKISLFLTGEYFFFLSLRKFCEKKKLQIFLMTHSLMREMVAI